MKGDGMDDAKQYRTARIRVPASEEAFWAWFDAQNAPSVSLLYLVNQQIKAHGNEDVIWNQAKCDDTKESN